MEIQNYDVMSLSTCGIRYQQRIRQFVGLDRDIDKRPTDGTDIGPTAWGHSQCHFRAVSPSTARIRARTELRMLAADLGELPPGFISGGEQVNNTDTYNTESVSLTRPGEENTAIFSYIHWNHKVNERNHTSIFANRDTLDNEKYFLIHFKASWKKTNLSDLIATTGLVILPKLDPNPTFWLVWHWNLTDDFEKQ